MSMIASVLHLDRRAVKALRITDPYSLHRVVYSLFEDVRSAEDKGASQTSGILYADHGGEFVDRELNRKVLLLADRMPADHIDGQYGQVQSKPIPARFLEHDQYRFKVVVNPTQRDRASGKTRPVKGRESIAAWFAERAPQSWGFQVSVAHLQVDRVEVLQFKDKQQHPVTLAQAHVQGQFRVTDRTQFQNSFAQGIGRGRAFGCGLLQIVPLIDNPFA
jgi:CRISPR system Cascade subunit CasE